MVQVSHVTARIASDTLARTETLYPEGYAGDPEPDDGASLLRSWRAQPPGRLFPGRPGYVQRVALDELGDALGGRAARVAVLVCPGDFVGTETPIAEVWPAEAAEACAEEALGSVAISSERDIAQDVDFGVRQLTDTALKATSPGINDPMTAVTCIGYLRSILVRLTERADPPRVLNRRARGPEVVARRRGYEEYLECLLQINRYVDGDAWVAGELLRTLRACAQAAARHSAPARMRSIAAVARTIGEQAAREAKNERDADHVRGLLLEIEAQAGGGAAAAP